MVIDAVRLLRDRGISVPVVFTGLPLESRDPLNFTTSAVLQRISDSGLRDLIIPLGLVRRDELTALMRRASLVVQPSEWEGWSTVVQDARAIGRPLICSDLLVHREQAPNALGFFSVTDTDMLAKLIEQHWDALSPGPHLELEHEGLHQAKEDAMGYGETILKVCAG